MSRDIPIWCRRHDVNVIHIDFEGMKHPANLTRELLKNEGVPDSFVGAFEEQDDDQN